MSWRRGLKRLIFRAERGSLCSCHCDKLAIRYQQLQIAECDDDDDDDDDDSLHAVSVTQPSQSWWVMVEMEALLLLQWNWISTDRGVAISQYNTIQYNTIQYGASGALLSRSALPLMHFLHTSQVCRKFRIAQSSSIYLLNMLSTTIN